MLTLKNILIRIFHPNLPSDYLSQKYGGYFPRRVTSREMLKEAGEIIANNEFRDYAQTPIDKL